MFFLRKNDFFYLKYFIFYILKFKYIYIFFCKMKSMLFTNNIIIYYFLFSIII